MKSIIVSMEEVTNVKRKSVLTIVAGVLCGINLVGIIILLVYLFIAPADSDLVYATFLLPFTIIASLVFAIVCKREHISKLWVVFLSFNIIFIVSSFILSPYLGAKLLYGGIANNAVDNAKERAKIENVKELIPEKNLTLHNEITEKSKFRYFDDDGTIANQFISMEFTSPFESSSWYSLSATYFKLSDDVDVTFSKDFDGIVIHAMYGTFWGYGEAYMSYSCDIEEGQKIKQMISDKVNEQKTAYESKEEEAIAGITIMGTLEAMNENDARFNCTFLDKRYEVGLTRQYDDDKEIFQALSELDESRMTTFEGDSFNHTSGFYYDSSNKSPYSISYYAFERCLIISKRYEDPYGGNRLAYVYYVLNEEDGAHLMDVANQMVLNKEASSEQP